MVLGETRRYRKFTAKQKLELVLTRLRGERSIAELCREHAISESLLRRWREQALEAASER
jgi:transposase-like protein